MHTEIILGDCLPELRKMADNSIDSIVTDPPYGLSFMGKKWDYDVPSIEIWAECLRVLKPGGHLLAFAGTRTQHRMAVRIEDAGFEIRDMIAWVYGSGFPKSLDVSKAIDKAVGAEREVTREGQTKAPEDAGKFDSAASTKRERRDEPATDAARQWEGWGTALKPALEPITVDRKPLAGTVAANVLAHGTGAINIDGCRVGTEGGTAKTNLQAGIRNGERAGAVMGKELSFRCDIAQLDAGRWPANLIHDGSEEVVSQFPQAPGQQGAINGDERSDKTANAYGEYAGRTPNKPRGDAGSAARFFYCAKASKRDREDGNIHPTVKPTDLMRYLCRLVTPPGGTVLDPFTGSGSTGKAAQQEGLSFIGIERDEAYVAIARGRLGLAPEFDDDLIG